MTQSAHSASLTAVSQCRRAMCEVVHIRFEWIERTCGVARWKGYPAGGSSAHRLGSKLIHDGTILRADRQQVSTTASLMFLCRKARRHFRQNYCRSP